MGVNMEQLFLTLCLTEQNVSTIVRITVLIAPEPCPHYFQFTFHGKHTASVKQNDPEIAEEKQKHPRYQKFA